MTTPNQVPPPQSHIDQVLKELGERKWHPAAKLVIENQLRLIHNLKVERRALRDQLTEAREIINRRDQNKE